MVYIQKKETAFAIDKPNNTVWEVRNLNQCKTISKLPASKLLLELIGRDSKLITEAEFQNQFSEGVEYFHNQTPFA